MSEAMSNQFKPVNRSRLLAGLMALVFAITFIGMTALPNEASAWNTKRIKWMSYSAGMKAAKQSGKSAIIVFEAKWCAICKRYKRVFYNKKVVALSKKLVMIRVNIDASKSLQNRYSPDGGYIPRTMAFSASGNHYADIGGNDHEFKYFLEVERAGELLSVMRRAIGRSK